MSDFHRIKRLPPYVFEQVNKIKAITATGDVILVPNPSYPSTLSGT
jgi:alanine-synthesizing transaminase